MHRLDNTFYFSSLTVEFVHRNKKTSASLNGKEKENQICPSLPSSRDITSHM